MEEKNGTVTKPKPTEPTGKMQFKFWYWKYWKSHTRKVLPPLQTIKRKCRALIGIVTWVGTELFYFLDFWTIIRFVGLQCYNANTFRQCDIFNLSKQSSQSILIFQPVRRGLEYSPRRWLWALCSWSSSPCRSPCFS